MNPEPLVPDPVHIMETPSVPLFDTAAINPLRVLRHPGGGFQQDAMNREIAGNRPRLSGQHPLFNPPLSLYLPLRML